MIIEKLQHGLFLCKKNFSRFVECWNDVVDRVANLKGDEDLEQDGYIKVDYTDDTHPVIRFDSAKLNEKERMPTDSEHSRTDCEALQQYSLDVNVDLSGDQYLNIYKFGADERSDISTLIQMSSDIIVRTHDLSGNTMVDYLALSDLNTLSGDSQFDEETSSVTTYELSGELSGNKAIMLYNFNTLSNDLSLDLDEKATERYTNNYYSLLVRDNFNKKLRYARLSVYQPSVSGDCQYPNDYKSISVNIHKDSDDEPRTKRLQLYNFDYPDQFIIGYEHLSNALTSNYKILVRDNENKQLKYANLSLDLSNDNSTADSEISKVALSSVQRYSYTDDEGKEHKTHMLFNFHNPDNLLLTYGDISSETKSDYKLLVRDNTTKSLRYANLSLDLSNALSTDSEIRDIGLSSVQRYSYTDGDGNTHKVYMLYNFDNPDTDFKIGLDKANPETNTRKKFLVRDADTGKLRYADLCVDFNWISGDSETGLNDYNSIQTYVQDIGNKPHTIVQLYGFQNNEKHSLELKVPSWYDYYYSGKMDYEPTGNDKENMDLVVRNRNVGQHSIDYRLISCAIPPFVHGDADSYPNTGRYSIDSVPFINSPDYTYYQLHNFNSPGSQSEESELLSDNYINIANGQKKGSDDNDMVLIRNENGELVYRKLYVKGDGGGGGQTIIERIEHVEERVVVICSDVSAVSADLYELSSNLSSKLSDDFWLQGGDVDTCYGSSIGNSSKSGVIGLDAQALYGNWTADADFKVNGDITCDNDIFGFSIKGDYGSFDTIRSYNGGDITVDNNIDMSNHEIKNVSKIGDINLADKELEGDWKTTGEHTVDSCINCDWLFKNDGQHGDGVNVGGLQLYGKWSTNDDFSVNGTLKIGNTTITESQLQQLLALLNSSNNVLNQSF